MPAQRPKIVVTRRLPQAVEARMEELFDVRRNQDDHPFSREELEAAMAEADVLVPTLPDRIDAALIAGAGDRLRLIANFGAGTDHIDLSGARARGILVSNTPGVLTEDTADLIMALILCVPRGFGEGERIVRAGGWQGWGPIDQLGRSLTGKGLGIVGMGRIGRAVAKRAAACGMAIHYHNRSRLGAEQEAGARYWPDLDAMLGQSDVVSLCCPYSPETHHLIDAGRLKLMKRDAFLINAARGNVVDEEALLDALEGGAIAGAGLDVYPNELEVNPRLVALPNVMLLPHLGSATLETRTAMGEKVIDNVLAWAAGGELPDRVV